MRGKWIAIGLALLTVFVVLVIGVEALVATSVPVVKGEAGRGYWAEAITAVSTVVVMAATTVYAAISYDMVRAIKQQTVAMSTSTTRAHVTELSRFLTTWINPLLALKASVALDSESTVDRIAEQDEASERVTAGIYELASFSSASPPSVMALIKPVTDAAFESITTVSQVRNSIIEAARSAMGANVDLNEDLFRRLYGTAGGPPADPSKDSRALDPSWDAVRDQYLLHFRDDAPGKPEWDDVISAKWLDEVYVVWAELITACTLYLNSS